MAYNFAGGDYVEGLTPGLYAAFGIEFLRNRAVGFGFEVAIDQSEIEFERKIPSGFGTVSTLESISPSGLVVSIFVIF